MSSVTANLFQILGVGAARGHGPRPGDERGAPVAVLSHELWRLRFGGVDDILARTIRLNGVEYAIVGVMPAGFAYPEPDMGAWVPIDVSARGDSDRSDHYLAAIGRLAPGASTDGRASTCNALPASCGTICRERMQRTRGGTSARSPCDRPSSAACWCRSGW